MGTPYYPSAHIPSRREELRRHLGKASWIVQRERAEGVLSRHILERHGTGARICELGTAHGAVLQSLLERGFRDVIGVDVDDYLTSDALRPHLRIADLNTQPIPAADGSLDCVLALETFEHLENPWHFARECVRMLRPGGTLILSTPWGHTVWDKLRFALRGNLVNFHLKNNHITFLTRDNFRRAFGKDFTLDRRIFQHGFAPFVPRRLRRFLPPHPLWSLKACFFFTRVGTS